MKRETALQIATRFYNFHMGAQPENLAVKSMEGAEGKVVLRTTTFDEDEDDDVTYEIEIDPTAGAISMKKVMFEDAHCDFLQKPKHLSELEPDELFRMKGDCLVWRFYGKGTNFGETAYGFTRKDSKEIHWLHVDIEVYPCGK